MKIFRSSAGYTLYGHKSNEEILEELKVEPADKKPKTYTSNWLRHVTRMNKNRMRTVMLRYRKIGEDDLEDL